MRWERARDGTVGLTGSRHPPRTTLGRNHAVLHGWGSQATGNTLLALGVGLSALFLCQEEIFPSRFSSGLDNGEYDPIDD